MPIRFHVMASDYDGTLALDGKVSESTQRALERAAATRRRLVMVTGRELDDLKRVYTGLHVFDRVIAENGSVLYEPAKDRVRDLAEPPPRAVVEALKRRGVPFSEGRTILATLVEHEADALAAVREAGAEMGVAFNKGALMLLPAGHHKGTGLVAALDELGHSPHEAVGIGDGENDHAFLQTCELAVAVSSAVPLLKEKADWVTPGGAGVGVEQLVDSLLANDLSDVAGTVPRLCLRLGQAVDGTPLEVPTFGTALLLTGPSASGKSTLATAVLEQLAGRGYQFCVVDPEGDYEEVAGAVVLGGPDRIPTAEEVVSVLERPDVDAVVNLLGVPPAERPAYFLTLASRLSEMYSRSGRPHWTLIDEAHHLMPAGQVAELPVLELASCLMITVHPEQLAEPIRERATVTIEFGDEQPVARLPGRPPVSFEPEASTVERRRHRRKYARGDLGDHSFVFRGPDGRLQLRAQNMAVFGQIAEGVDDDTWLFHLKRHDYSSWIRDPVKDPELAAEVERVESSDGTPDDTRRQVLAAIQRRYTLPD